VAGSNAISDLRSGLGAVDDVLGYVKQTAGKPSTSEQSLFVASVALSYAVWENYVEEVAIEATTILSTACAEASVPTTVRESIMNAKPTAWDLAVYPGWRELWLQVVRQRAKGDPDKDDFGINSAGSKNVAALFERVGVSPFDGVSGGELEELDRLVEQRGQIVHTGKAPDEFRKKDATSWRGFVESLGTKVDSSIAKGVNALVGTAPW